IVSLHRQAARELGMRLLVQRGWGDLSLDDDDQRDVLVAGPLPHDWLFPRSAAVVHHGGIGVTARALKHRRPMLVEPYGRDQFFNAYRIVQLGAGVAMHPHQLTVRGLCQAFTRLQSDSIRSRVADVAGHIDADGGIDHACDLIESYLASQSPRNPIQRDVVPPSPTTTIERSLP
ncbi:MAG TPA: nucleotide disphospho-sugar-binding domain-containing protein, partial [Longimicrobium sp.]|nr:nucleotide disphospho-sugar-binding domain-containing protein [Longimicrobium sp.]